MMQIYELEVSNYKSIENYEFPLRFSDLNLFIGENDSGKTALLEAMMALFGNKEVTLKDFYDSSREIKIKARLFDVFENCLTNEMNIFVSDKDALDEMSLGIPFYGFCAEEIIDMPQEIELLFEEEGLDLLKDYSFYGDLKAFYLHYKKHFTIIFEKIYWAENDKIQSGTNIYFYYPLKQSAHIQYLLKNKEFIEFMSSAIKKIADFFEDLSSKYPDLPDHLDILGTMDETNEEENIKSSIINRRVEETVRKINKLINNRLYPEFCDWDYNVQIDPSGVFDNEDNVPYLNYFSASDLDEPKISKKLYKDQFEALFYLEKKKDDPPLLKDIYHFLNEKLNEYLLKKITHSADGNKYFNEIRENFIRLLTDLNIDNSLELDFEFSLDNFDKIKKSLEPSIKLFSIEGRRPRVDLSNKSQGFLRKLLICDFLMQVDTIGSENENGRLLLIEEPEIHLHIHAQKTIMKVLKDRLGKSNSQVFVTTHSHTIIEDTGLENLFVFKKNMETGKSIIKNLKQIGFFDREEILQETMNSIGAKNTDLLFFKKVIVLLEGEHDVAFIKGLCERQEIAIDTEKILFKHALGQANLQYYVGLGEFLNLKTMVVYDKHHYNFKDKEKLQKNPYISDKLKENIVKIEVLDKNDILDYLDFSQVAKYKFIVKEKIPKNNSGVSMKDFLKANNVFLDKKDIKYLAKTMAKVPQELQNKIISFLKLMLFEK